MTESSLYHEGNRRLQDQFESRRVADRLESFARLTPSFSASRLPSADRAR
jgi:hypothetical protein